MTNLARRRVPGLRREEVAQLAAVSVDYYTRLEKGHLETASPTVLDAIARSLQLDAAERAHLFALARLARGEESGNTLGRVDAVVRRSLGWMLDGMGLCPAYCRDRRLDVLAWNARGRALYEPMFDVAGRTPNLALFCFLDERAQVFYPQWPDVAEGTVALLRAEFGRNSADRVLNEHLDRLLTHSEPFRTLWASHDVRLAPAETALIQHPVVGELTLAVEAMHLAANPELTMVVYAAEPASASADGLSRLEEVEV